MAFKKKLFGIPATVLGVALGLLAGGLAIAKDLFEKKTPKIGLFIMVATPVISFFFEQVMSRAFPESYWEKLAGKLVRFYRYLINEDFRLRFFYEMRFLISPDSPKDISSELICESVGASPGKVPEPTFIGSNFVHLRYLGSPFLVSIRWHIEEVEEDDASESAVTVFRLTMEPEVQRVVMRNARDDIEKTIARLSQLQQSLVLLFKSRPEVLAVADAWFGESMPPATPIPRTRVDSASGATYRLFPGLLHVSGQDLSSLSTVHRCVGTLQPPPEPE